MSVDFRRIVRAGDTVLWTHGVGEPVPLVARLLEQRHAIGPFTVLSGGAGYHPDLVRPEHADVVTFVTLGAVGSNRALAAAGVAEILPCHLSTLPTLLERGDLRVDVVLAHLAEDGADRFSHGPVNGYLDRAIATARRVVAEVNDQAPWTHTRQPVDADRVEVVLRTSRPLVDPPQPRPTATDRAIATHVADLVPDGATVQFGVGGLPAAVARALTGRRDLGVHSGVIGDAVHELIEAGTVTNTRKPVDTGVTVTGGLVGGRHLLDFAHRNPALRVDPVTYTHDPDVLRRLPGLTAINSALEVDLTGQVGAEAAGTRYVGTVGGQVDFVRGALSAPGGRSIIALPARTGDGRPRIVARIGSGAVTSLRADADYVVTEYGVAHLRGRTIRDRVHRMVAVAHPDDREPLLRAAAQQIGGYR